MICFRCIVDQNSDILDIDSDSDDNDSEEVSVYVYVSSFQHLTPLDSDTMLVVSMVTDIQEDSIIPCIPTSHDVRVDLVTSSGQEDVTHLVQFDPRLGFIVSPGTRLPSSSLVCQFSQTGGKMSENVTVQIISTNKGDDNQDNPVIEAMILE